MAQHNQRRGMDREEAGSIGGSRNTAAQQRARQENIKKAQRARRNQD